MTGEEAKKILRKLLAEDEDIDFFSYDEKEAVNHFAYLPENKGDLISRQAVLNEMDKRHAEGDCITKGFIKALPSVKNKGEWIPVTERLPEEPYACWVTVWDTNVLTQEEFENVLPYPIGYDGETWNDGDGNICPFEVIAWMPAPEPYKEGGNE